MNNYKVFTEKGTWTIDATDDLDALRIALWLCWRDGERFKTMQYIGGARRYTVAVAVIDNNEFYTING